MRLIRSTDKNRRSCHKNRCGQKGIGATMKICVFGAASNEIDKEYIRLVEEFGEMLAKRGHSLVFGAGNNGLMGACARGVTKGGGKIQGVIPSFFRTEAIEEIYGECDELILTETMAERKSKMEELADAFVIVPGGIGTFEEMFEVLTLKQLGRHEKAIVIYDIADYYDGIDKMLEKGFRSGFIRNDCRLLYHCTNDPKDILDYLEGYKPIGLTVHDLKDG